MGGDPQLVLSSSSKGWPHGQVVHVVAVEIAQRGYRETEVIEIIQHVTQFLPQDASNLGVAHNRISVYS